MAGTFRFFPGDWRSQIQSGEKPGWFVATGGYRFPERWSGVLAKGSRFELERLSSEGREGSAAHELHGRERFGARF
jgi:hypothetical protein